MPPITFDLLSVLFLSVLLMTSVFILLWLSYLGKAHRFYAVYDIVRSWCGILAVLLVVFALGWFALMLFAVCMGIQAVKEWHNVIKHPYQTVSSCTLEKYLIKPMTFVLIMAFSVSFMYLAYLLTMNNQLSVLLWLIFTAQIDDVSQYLMGKSFGHKFFKGKLAPNISPNKTKEGFIFGVMLTSVLSVMVGQLLTPFSLLTCFALAWMICLLGVLGDLSESLFKRCHGVKDTAHWLKGHGGLLDRIDSLLFAVPIFTLVYVLCLS